MFNRTKVNCKKDKDLQAKFEEIVIEITENVSGELVEAIENLNLKK